MLGLGILAGLSLFGYALVNLIRMPAVSPDALVPKELSQSGRSVFSLLQFLWLSGKAAIVCLALSVFCLVHIPIYFGTMALE
jgi:hypothetical protein